MPHSPDRPTHAPARTLLLIAAFAALALQLYGLYNPAPDSSSLPSFFEGEDKVVHFLLFAAPVFLFRLTGVSPRLLGSVFILHAVLSEVIQGAFLPNRDGSWGDALADILGVLAALLLAASRTSRPSQDFGAKGAAHDR